LLLLVARRRSAVESVQRFRSSRGAGATVTPSNSWLG
jgi:hypothetical protein